MKIVCTSDCHGDWVTHGVRRFPEIQKAMDQVVDRAIEEKADVFAFLGDACNPDSGSSTFRVSRMLVGAASRLAARGIWSIWVAGNHDVIEDGTGETTLSPLEGLIQERVIVCERPRALSVLVPNPDPRDSHGRLVWFLVLPYTATSHPYDVEATVRGFQSHLPPERHARPEDVVVLAHMTRIEGVEPGEEETEMSRGRAVALPVNLLKEKASTILNGHFHRQQKYGPVWIPGSLVRLTFSEEGHEPGYLVVNL